MTTFDDDTSSDEDTFLTALESKLRGPFSSVELARFITPATTPLIARVLHRAEKVTQLRILTGLLGVSPAEDKTESLLEIVQVAQKSPDYEEWVRVIAGIVQDKLNLGGDGDTGDLESRRTLRTSCSTILDRVREVEKKSAVIDEGTEHLLGQSDVHPTFAPFRTFLDVNPENDSKFQNEHFRINKNAEILHIDARLEKEKAKEEASHKQTTDVTSKPASASTASRPAAVMPGANRDGRKKVSRPPPKKSSMFMPTKKPSIPAKGTLLRKRKGAQALVSKGRNRSASSKTKLVDIDAVKVGNTEKQSLIPDKGKAKLKRKAETPETSKISRPKVEQQPQNHFQENPSPAPSPSRARQQDWREMLEKHSNMLTASDRERIRQFFEEHTNPTPAVDNYRCKLHEVRTPSEKTTYYIELDYKSFKSKEFSKVKKYNT